MKSRILVVADDAALRAMLARTLLQAGYAVELAESPRRAREVLADDTVMLGILALQGLGAAGAELAGEIEKAGRLLLVMESGEALPQGLQTGARLTRPFSEQDLVARVKAAASEPRPVAAAPQEAPLLAKFEGYTLDTGARTCVDAKGKELTLTRAEFSLLAAFVRQPGRVLSRDELTYVVAGRGAEPEDRSVDVLISRLRRKIEPDPKNPRIIVTLPGEGYRFTAKSEPVERAKPAAVAPMPSVQGATEPLDESIAVGGRGMRALWAGAAVLAVLAFATIGWTTWKFRAVSKQVAEVAQAVTQPVTPPTPSVPAPPQPSQEVQRAVVFKRMIAALQDDRYSWRTVERLAIEAGVEEIEAHEILAEHPDEIVLGKSHEGKLIARLSVR